MDRDYVIEQVLQQIEDMWKSTKDEPVPDFSWDDNLFDLGVLDSLGIMQLLTLAEDLSNTEIDFTVIEPEQFFTIEGVCNYVLSHLSTDRLEQPKPN